MFHGTIPSFIQIGYAVSEYLCPKGQVLVLIAPLNSDDYEDEDGIYNPASQLNPTTSCTCFGPVQKSPPAA